MLENLILVINSNRLSNVIKMLVITSMSCASLALNPIKVYSYGFLLNCVTVGLTSDSMTALK